MIDDEEEYGGESDVSFVEPSAPVDRGTRIRSWIAGILAIIAVLIFVADRFLVLVQPNIERIQNTRREATLGQFEQELHRVLADFGILDTWIRKRQIIVGEQALHRNEWLISIPRDLAVASVNYEIKAALEGYDTHTFAVENAKNRQVTIHVRIGPIVRYSLVFTPSDAIHRKAGRLIFMLDKLVDAPNSEIETLLSNKDPIACCITPTNDAAPVFDKLRLAQKDIVLHLHIAAHKGEAVQYALNEDLSDDDIRRKIRGILKHFGGARAYFITTEITPSKRDAVAHTELDEAGLRKLDPAVFSYLDRTSESGTMASRVNDVSNAAIKSGIGIGVVELDDGTMSFLTGEMSRLRRRGFTFLRPSQL